MTGAEVAIAGMAISAYGAYSSSQAKAKALEEQAKLREQQAYQSYLAGEREARLTIRRGEQFKSAQVAGQGQSGTVVAAGSNLLALEETVAMYQEDALAIRQASAYRTNNSGIEAAADRSAASQERDAGLYNIASIAASAYGKSTAPSSGPSVSNNYYGRTGSGEYGR